MYPCCMRQEKREGKVVQPPTYSNDLAGQNVNMGLNEVTFQP